MFKLRTAPNYTLKTSLDELDQAERHLNEGLARADWLGIRVYEPERQENSEIQWHLTKNPSDKLQSIMTVRIYGGHAFWIRHIKNYQNFTLIYTNLSPAATRKNMRPRKNNYQLPKRAGRSPVDNLWESVLRQKQVFGVISWLAWADNYKQVFGNAYPSPFMRAWRREVACWRFCWQLWPGHEDAIPIPRLPLAWMCKIISEWQTKV